MRKRSSGYAGRWIGMGGRQSRPDIITEIALDVVAAIVAGVVLGTVLSVVWP